MSKKKSRFLIVTEQKDRDNSDKMELKTDGYIWKDGEHIVLQYNETKATGFDGSVMTIKAAENTVFVNRNGEYSASMVIEKSKEHYAHYETPMGGVDVSTKAYSVKNNLTENGGEIAMKYGVFINGMFANFTHIKITAEVV